MACVHSTRIFPTVVEIGDYGVKSFSGEYEREEGGSSTESEIVYCLERICYL